MSDAELESLIAKTEGMPPNSEFEAELREMDNDKLYILILKGERE
jgi:hypothetical protein